MWPARDFEKALRRRPYYYKLCKWVMCNTAPECASNLKQLHPDYSGTLLGYYHLDALTLYVEQLKFADTDDVTVDDKGVVIRGWGRYTYYPLDPVGCIGMIYSLIEADPYVYDRNIEVGQMLLDELSAISPIKAKELQCIVKCIPFSMTGRTVNIKHNDFTRTRRNAMESGIHIQNQFGPTYTGGDAPKEDPLDAIRRYAAFREVDGKVADDMNAIEIHAPKSQKGDNVDSPKKKVAKKEGQDTKPKIITSTFEYKYADQKDGTDRVFLLFRVLSSKKFQRIDSGASPDDWEALFSGKPSSFQIKWTGTIQHLYHVFYEAKKRELIKPKGAGIWQIVASHFIKEDDSIITTDELNSQHPAKEEKDALNMLVDILDVSIPIDKNVKI